MTTTLNVWKLRSDNPGHVSLQVDATYISYWPSGPAGKGDVKIGTTHEPSYPSSYALDRRLERKPADVQLLMPRLNTAAVLAAWAEFKLTPRRYNLIDHNCSTVIAALLEIGSGVEPSFVPGVLIDNHASGWAQRMFLRVRFLSDSITMWTPDAVLQYAEEINR